MSKLKTKVRCYDNGGKTFDRYMIAIVDKSWASCCSRPGCVPMLGLSENPTHPQGFSQFCDGMVGKHLGKQIKFSDLPDNIQKHVIDRLDKED